MATKAYFPNIAVILIDQTSTVRADIAFGTQPPPITDVIKSCV